MSAQLAISFEPWLKPGLSQCDAILAYMQYGYTISPALAYELFGSLALHSRIAELRGRGHEIPCVIVSRNGKRFGQYSLGRA